MVRFLEKQAQYYCATVRRAIVAYQVRRFDFSALWYASFTTVHKNVMACTSVVCYIYIYIYIYIYTLPDICQITSAT